MRSNIVIALLCLFLGAALADWLSAGDVNAQALPPSSGGSDACTGQACTVTSLSATTSVTAGTKLVASAGSGNNAVEITSGAKLCFNGSTCTRYMYDDGFGNFESGAMAFRSSAGLVVSGVAVYGQTDSEPVNTSYVADGANADGWNWTTSNTLSTAGALLHNFKNGGTTKMAVTSFGGLYLVGMTTAARDALAGADLRAGTLIYNTTTNKLNFYSGSGWEAVTSL